MNDKFGTIKNPLTIIAIFAGIAEVSGTGVLPFVDPPNQLTFIYFLITFPTVLIILFFLTLNFNNKALYAPSDFTDEENYIKIFKYDISKQENIQIEVPQEKFLKTLNESFVRFQKINDDKLLQIERKLTILKTSNFQKISEKSDESYENLEVKAHPVKISNFRNANTLRKLLIAKGHNAAIYNPVEDDEILNSYSDHKSIWLGERVPLSNAIDIITTAKNMFDHLEYIDLSDDDAAPDYVHDSIFIGGATESAVSRNLKKLSRSDFEKIKSMASLNDLHSFVRSFRP